MNKHPWLWLILLAVAGPARAAGPATEPVCHDAQMMKSAPSAANSAAAVDAAAAMQRGQQAFARNDLEQAAIEWRSSMIAYQQANDFDGQCRAAAAPATTSSPPI